MLFVYPQVLLILFLIWPVGLAIHFYRLKINRLRLLQWVHPRHSSSLTPNFKPLQKWKTLVLLSGLSSMIVALARPQFGSTTQVIPVTGAEVLFLIDVSKSMLAQDLKPNRLQRAKLAVLELGSHLKGNQLGLIPFAGAPFLLCPLTVDFNAFQEALKLASPESVPAGGTHIAAAIEEGLSAFSSFHAEKIMILMSDGEDLEGIPAALEAKLIQNKIKLFTIGIGTVAGELIPIEQANGHTDFLKDAQGNLVQSRLDERTLSALALSTGGFYTHLGIDPLLNHLQQKALKPYYNPHYQEIIHEVPIERFVIPLGIALALLCLYPLLGVWVSAIFVCCLGLWHQPIYAETQDAIRYYNQGIDALEKQAFDDAKDAFSQALMQASPSLQSQIYFNRGHTWFEEGAQLLDHEPEKTLDLWRKALLDFEIAQELQPHEKRIQEDYQTLQQAVDDLKKMIQPPASASQKANPQDSADSSSNSSDDQDTDQPNPDDQKDDLSDQQEQTQPNDQQQLSSKQETPSATDSTPNRADAAHGNDPSSSDQAKDHQTSAEPKQSEGDSNSSTAANTPLEQSHSEPNSTEPSTLNNELMGEQKPSSAHSPTAAQATTSHLQQSTLPAEMTEKQAIELIESAQQQSYFLPIQPSRPHSISKNKKDW